MTTARKKTTVYLDPDLLRAAKVLAASTGRREYEVLEDALRQYIKGREAGTSRQALRSILDQFAARSDMGDDEALDMAYAALRAVRNTHRID